MEFETLIRERYSVRSFKPLPLSKEALDTILAAGHVAPTGCNKQPQRILVLNTEESMKLLEGCTRCRFGAPSAMLIFHNKSESWVRPYDGALASPVDAAIVTTHMMLAAHNIGVGACWVMHFDPAAVKETFRVPEEYEPAAILILGYPSEDASPKHYHGEFRPMDEVVYFEHF
jgi:nitroreductase